VSRQPARLAVHWPTVVLVSVGVAGIVAAAALGVSSEVIALLASIVAAGAGLSPAAASRPSSTSSTSDD
jgi:hypothetical protein